MKGGGHALRDTRPGLLSPVLCPCPDSAPARDVFRVVFVQEAPDAAALNGRVSLITVGKSA